MTTTTFPFFISVLALALSSQSAFALTTQIDPSVYQVDKGVDFTLGNTGASDFLFNWSDPADGSSFSDLADITLVLSVGQTYTFRRVTGAHPFAILDDSASDFITGSDGSYNRTTTNTDTINATILNPISDFRADPGPTSDLITWTPDVVGDYWYTCLVGGHQGMSGRISVVPEPATAGLLMGLLAVGFLSMSRRRKRA